MKVGIFLSNQIPEAGGGYTFESEILDALLRYNSETKHQFILMDRRQKPPQRIASIQNINIKYLSLYRSLGARAYSKVTRTITALSRRLCSPHPLTKFEIEQLYNKNIVDTLRANAIDITWNLGPGCPTLELPYITTVWDLQHRLQPYFPEVSTGGEWESREKHYEILLRRSSFIITGTRTGKVEIEEFYQIPSERIKVLPFPTPEFAIKGEPSNKQEILKKYNLPTEYLLYPAQFWPHKNHTGLVLAIKELHNKYNIVFPIVFVGSDKGNQSYIKQLVTDLDLSKQVHFLGFVQQQDLISLYHYAFALVFVTFFGPDNLPPLEAFALGCPVIASNVPGASEQLGDAALLVDPKKPEKIALAIKSFLDNDSLRQTFIQRGKIKASEWTTQDYIKGVFSILDEFQIIRRCWSSTQTYHQN